MTATPAPRRRHRRHDRKPLADPVLPPGPATVDLHAHTRRSDGVMEPADLVRAAAACGVTTFALTDHDSLAGFRDVVATAAIPAGLELVAGVEINSIVTEEIGLWEGELHVLGFGMDPDDEAFEAALAAQRAHRLERFDRTVRRLAELGMPIGRQLEIVGIGADDALGRPIVGRALVAAGFATSVEDAFRRLIGRGGPAYVPRDGLGPQGAIRAIRGAGGLPVLAHFAEAPERVPLIRELIEVGLGGLEVYYRAFDRPAVAALESVAQALRLVATGGSDYHGDTGSYADLHAVLWVPPEVTDGVHAAGVVGSVRQP